MTDYTKNNIGSGYNTTTSLNAELEKVETAVNSKLDKTGGSLSGDLSMESNDLLNVNHTYTAGLTLNGEVVTSVDSLGTVTFPSLSSVTYTNTSTGAVGRPLQERLEDTVSVLDFGAVGDGVTDDTAAIQAALDSIAPTSSSDVFYGDNGGTVYIPKGIYQFSSEITVPEFVNIKGAGKGATVLRATAAGAKVTYGTTSASFSTAHRGGHNSGFTIDGNEVATGNLLHVGFVVERDFEDIDVVNSLGNGLLVEAAQNCNFLGCGFQHNGKYDGTGSSIVLDYGAGNLRFYGCEINRPGEYNVKIVQSGTSPVGGFSVPTNNRFYGCMIERWEDALVSGTLTSAGTIYHGAGRVNRFIDCDISLTGLPSAAPVVTVRKDGAGAGSPFYFQNCSFSGTLAYSTAFDIDDAVTVSLIGKNFFENHNTLFKVGDSAFLDTDKLLLSSYTTLFANQSGGTKTQDQIVGNRDLNDVIRKDVRSAVSEVAYSLAVDGETNPRWEWLPNGLRGGDGTGTTDVTLVRESAAGVAAWAINSPMKVQGTAAVISAGTGAPTAAFSDGSIYLRTDGGASTALYVRENGAWVLK